MLSQSPIDLENLTFNHLSPLRHLYGSSVQLEVANNGSPDEEATIRANVKSGTNTLDVDGVRYNLVQFHFHTPSEHTAYGTPSPIEMHLVHSSAAGQLLVVGVMIEVGLRHRELDKIFHALTPACETSAIPSFNLNALLPHTLTSCRYSGSLTTPNFCEGVNWVVLTEPITMSATQIAALQRIFPHGNTRPVQSRNDRRVICDADMSRASR